ncbi:unnamed protein product [Linum trigynum]|uniref:Transmembrane protein n=1 Tax=Linum trigynum TaxID=586398 RepID=A0AAV2FEQ9_9ROSI
MVSGDGVCLVVLAIVTCGGYDGVADVRRGLGGGGGGVFGCTRSFPAGCCQRRMKAAGCGSGRRRWVVGMLFSRTAAWDGLVWSDGVGFFGLGLFVGGVVVLGVFVSLIFFWAGLL